MSFFSSKKSAVQFRLIVDVQPNSIGVGITHPESSELKYIDRQYVAYGRRPTARQMQSKLSDMLAAMMQTKVMPFIASGRIASVLCLHSSAWCIAETHTVDLHFPRPMRITEDLVVKSVNKHRAGRDAHSNIDDGELVYHHIQKVRLNGYSTDHPWNKTAQFVSCDFIEGYVDRTMKRLCDAALLRYGTSVVHVPEAFVITEMARQTFPKIDQLFIVYMGGETTEIMYGDRYHLRRSASAPVGIAGIVRKVAAVIHDNNEVAFSHIRTAVKGNRMPTKKEQSAISDAVNDWRNAFLKAVHMVCGNCVPEKVLFLSSLHDTDIAEYLITDKKLSVWSGKEHEVINLFGKKSFQHDAMIAAGASYVVK